jgi:hypothetical protein
MVFRKKASTRELASAKAKEIGTEVGVGVGHLRNAAVATAGAARDAVKPAVGSAREALAPKVDAARVAVTPKLEQARDAVAPKYEAARDGAVTAVKPKVDQVLVSLAPLVAAAVEAQQSSKKQVKKSAKKLGKLEKQTRGQRKEAARRAVATRAALKGERQRKWPWMLAAVAAGTAVGVVASLVVKRKQQPEWTEYDAPAEPSKLETAKEKAAETVSSVKEKAAAGAEKAKSALPGKGKESAEPKTTVVSTTPLVDTSEVVPVEVVEPPNANSHRA